MISTPHHDLILRQIHFRTYVIGGTAPDVTVKTSITNANHFEIALDQDNMCVTFTKLCAHQNQQTERRFAQDQTRHTLTLYKKTFFLRSSLISSFYLALYSHFLCIASFEDLAVYKRGILFSSHDVQVDLDNINV